jgi:hypothetical protein
MTKTTQLLWYDSGLLELDQREPNSLPVETGGRFLRTFQIVVWVSRIRLGRRL